MRKGVGDSAKHRGRGPGKGAIWVGDMASSGWVTLSFKSPETSDERHSLNTRSKNWKRKLGSADRLREHGHLCSKEFRSHMNTLRVQKMEHSSLESSVLATCSSSRADGHPKPLLPWFPPTLFLNYSTAPSMGTQFHLTTVLGEGWEDLISTSFYER